MSFKYFNKGNKDVFRFFQMPVQLLQNPRFKQLSDGAKILITCMIDRRSLSEKSRWHDKQGRIYIYYPLHQICEDLSVSKQKAVNMLNELENAELIKRTRQGLGRPSRIYVGLISNSDWSEAIRKTEHTRSNQVCETDSNLSKQVCETDNSDEVVQNEDTSEPEAVRKDIHEKSNNQSSMSALDRLLEECKRDSTYTNNTDTEDIYTESNYGYREPASKEAYEREMPKTREEVLEEYRKMKERGEEDMKLVELMLLATN